MELDPKKFYKFLAPRPTVLLTTVDKSEGVLNTTPFSFTMPVSIDPPLIAIAVGSTKHALKNIRSTREFVINIPSIDLLENFWKCLQENPAGVSELRKAGLTEMISSKVLAPSITECIAWFECLLDYEKELGDHTLVVGEVVKVFVRDEIISEGFIDITRARNLLHIGGSKFAVAEREIKAGSMKVSEVMSRERSRRQPNRRIPPERDEPPMFQPGPAPERQRKTRQFNRLMDKLNLVDNGRGGAREEIPENIAERTPGSAAPREQDHFGSQEFDDTIEVLKKVTETKATRESRPLTGGIDGRGSVKEGEGRIDARSVSDVVKLCAQDTIPQNNNIPKPAPVEQKPAGINKKVDGGGEGSGLFKARSVSGVVTLSNPGGSGQERKDPQDHITPQAGGNPAAETEPGTVHGSMKPSPSPLKEPSSEDAVEAVVAGGDVVDSEVGSGESLVGVEGARSVIEKVRSANTLNARVQQSDPGGVAPQTSEGPDKKIIGKVSSDNAVKTAPAPLKEASSGDAVEAVVAGGDVVGSEVGSGESLVGVEGARSVIEKVRSANTLNARVQQGTPLQDGAGKGPMPGKAAPATSKGPAGVAPVKEAEAKIVTPKAPQKAMGDHVLGVVKKVKSVAQAPKTEDGPSKTEPAKPVGMEQVKKEINSVKNGEDHVLGLVKKIDPESHIVDVKETKDTKSRINQRTGKPGDGKEK